MHCLDSDVSLGIIIATFVYPAPIIVVFALITLHQPSLFPLLLCCSFSTTQGCPSSRGSHRIRTRTRLRILRGAPIPIPLLVRWNISSPPLLTVVLFNNNHSLIHHPSPLLITKVDTFQSPILVSHPKYRGHRDSHSPKYNLKARCTALKANASPTCSNATDRL